MVLTVLMKLFKTKSCIICSNKKQQKYVDCFDSFYYILHIFSQMNIFSPAKQREQFPLYLIEDIPFF